MQVTDKQITKADANTGIPMREAINNIFEALNTQNSGATPPQNPQPFMPWVDTSSPTTHYLKCRNHANDEWFVMFEYDVATKAIKMGDFYTKTEVNTLLSDVKVLTLSGVTAYHLLSGKLSLSNTVMDIAFSTFTYTGNSTTPPSVNLGFDVESQWGDDTKEKFGYLFVFKSRSASGDWTYVDSVRGKDRYISSSTTAAQAIDTNMFTLNTVGGITTVTMGSSARTNSNGVTYVLEVYKTTHRASSIWASPELITNGNFDTNLTGWTVGGGVSVSWVSGKAEITWLNTSSTYCMYQTIPTVAGKRYTLKVTSSQSSGADNLYMKVGNTPNDGTIASVIQPVGNDHILTFTATGTTTYISLFFGENIGDKGYVDNVSVKECHTPTNHSKFWECHYNHFSGFTIDNYEGSNTTGHGIPHHLGRKIDLEMIKCLSSAVNWEAHALGKYFIPNLNNAGVDYAYTITDTVTVQGVNSSTNVNGLSHILYGWVNSYYDQSNTLIGNFEIGIYQGMGSSNKIPTKNKAALVMPKSINTTDNWYIFDNKRANDGHALSLNSSAIEDTTYDYMNFNSDGFTLNASYMNQSGTQYLYMVIYDNDAGSGKSKFPRATDSSYLNLNALVPFAQGIDSKGTKNTILSKNETLGALTFTEGKNYVYAKSDGTYGVKSIAPSYGTSNPATGDFFHLLENKWYTSAGVEITESRNYLDAIVYADAGGQITYVEQLSKVEYKDIIKANYFIGGNAPSAVVKIDGTTTPPTILSSYGNIATVIRTATGIFDIYFKEQYAEQYTAFCGASGGSGAGALYYYPNKVTISTVNLNPYALQNIIFSVEIIGGKN